MDAHHHQETDVSQGDDLQAQWKQARLHREENDEYWHINLLTADKPDETRISSAMAEAAWLTNASADDLAITALAEMDWLAENRKSFPPRAIGSFWIYGTHISDPVPEGAIGLCLDAGQAFGSGSHATTAEKGCAVRKDLISSMTVQ